MLFYFFDLNEKLLDEQLSEPLSELSAAMYRGTRA